MVRQSPDRAYDIAFFDEFARAAGWTERLSLENPEFGRRVDHRPVSVCCETGEWGDRREINSAKIIPPEEAESSPFELPG